MATVSFIEWRVACAFGDNREGIGVPKETKNKGAIVLTNMSRRAFLGRAGLSAVGFAALSGQAGGQDVGAGKSKVVLVRHSGATNEEGAGHAEIVRAMVDRAVRELTNKDAPAEAWRTLVKPEDVVGIKVNLRGGRYLSTQPCVVDAIVAGLLAAGVKENNIVVWDAWNREFGPAGYTLNDSDQGVRYYGTDRGTYPGNTDAEDRPREPLKPHYQETPVPVADKEVFFSKILAEQTTALINVPLIKDHRIAGVTCAMKNHFGSILNPSDLHGNRCDPYLAALNATPPIKTKTRLILVDGLRALYNGGPRDRPPWRWRPNCILAGADPVAIDAIALRLIEEKRQEVGMPPIGERAKHISTAAGMGLGTDDPAQIELRELDLTGG